MRLPWIDRSPIDESWSQWRLVFAWFPVKVENGYLTDLYWLCRMEKRTMKWRGRIFDDCIFTKHEYRTIQN